MRTVADTFELEDSPIVITQVNMDISSGSISSSTGFDSSWTLNFENDKKKMTSVKYRESSFFSLF